MLYNIISQSYYKILLHDFFTSPFSYPRRDLTYDISCIITKQLIFLRLVPDDMIYKVNKSSRRADSRNEVQERVSKGR